jgi:hypothetical protein
VAGFSLLPSRTRARGANRQDGGAHPSAERADGSNVGQSQGYRSGALSPKPPRGCYSRGAHETTSGNYIHLRRPAVKSRGKIANLGRRAAPLRAHAVRSRAGLQIGAPSWFEHPCLGATAFRGCPPPYWPLEGVVSQPDPPSQPAARVLLGGSALATFEVPSPEHPPSLPSSPASPCATAVRAARHRNRWLSGEPGRVGLRAPPRRRSPRAIEDNPRLAPHPLRRGLRRRELLVEHAGLSDLDGPP